MAFGLSAAAIGGIAAGAGVVGGALISSGAAGDASAAQAASSQAALAENAREFDKQQQNQTPYRNAGSAALGQMSDLLGVPTFDAAAYLRDNPDVAADPYWSQHAQDHYQQLGQAEGRSMPTVAPSANFGSYAKPLTQSEVQLDPGYQFGLQQGQQAIDRKTAAAGGRISGASLKAAAQYGTNYATTGYADAYNRANQARSDRLNRLAALAGIGQTGTQQVNSAGQAFAGMNSGIITAQGNATGAGQMAQGNIWGNAGNQLASLYSRYGGGGAPAVTDGGYGVGQGSAYGGTYDASGMFTPNRAGM